MIKNAIVIGSSDGIGLALTRELLKQGWKVIGLSRSQSKIKNRFYAHHVVEVQKEIYLQVLESELNNIKTIDLCVYCPGIGELLDTTKMQEEMKVFEVNLLGMVKTVSCVIPRMISQGKGHFIGLSSVADEMLSPEAPSYHASKAGFSNYLEGLGLALRPKGVNVTNVRFGFVDTKMAKGDAKPFMMGADEAVNHLMKCMHRKPIRYTAPRIIIPLVKFRKMMQSFSVR